MKFPIFRVVPPVLPPDTTAKSLALSSLHPPSGIYRHCSDPPEPSPPEGEQPHLSASPLMTASCLHPCFSLCKMLKTGALAPFFPWNARLQGDKGLALAKVSSCA